MNCLIQSGPGETHILDTSVLYIHIKYTNRIQILSDRRFVSGKSSKGEGDHNCGTMTTTALQCDQNIAWILGNGQDFRGTGPGPTKYFYSDLWVYSRLVRGWSSLICLPLTISFDTFNSKWLKWRWRTSDLHFSLVLKSEYKWWIRTSVLLAFSRIDSRLFKVSSSEVQNH